MYEENWNVKIIYFKVLLEIEYIWIIVFGIIGDIVKGKIIFFVLRYILVSEREREKCKLR